MRPLPRMLHLAAALCLAAACDDDPVTPPHETELERARAATERYADLSRALADGYEDIDVVMANMGHHYLRADLLDERFEAERPEILVYAPEGGGMRLVAVEYAVPLDRSAAAPEGFTGAGDVWDRNTTFGLWTLHAWIWLENPDGVFAPLNPRVP